MADRPPRDSAAKKDPAREKDATPESRFIGILLGLRQAADSANRSVAARARQDLARLRHSLLDGRQTEAYGVVFAKDLPASETDQRVWVLVGGLFALNPDGTWHNGHSRSIGASMGALARQGNSAAVERRFTQLLGRDPGSLPHQLRQVVRLLGDRGVAVHHGQLLSDLRHLLGPDPRGDEAARVRLTWARDYHRPPLAENKPGQTESARSATDFPETPA